MTPYLRRRSLLDRVVDGPRPVFSGVLSFGLLAIPVENHSATNDEIIRFHLLHAMCGSRLRNRGFCPACQMVIEGHDLVRGYEFEKGQYDQQTGDELTASEPSETATSPFVNLSIKNIDLVFFSALVSLA